MTDGTTPRDPPHDPVAALAAVRAGLARACRDEARDPAEITLVAVSKTHPAGAILPLLEAGHRAYGENRVQEARAKWPDLKARFPGTELHLVGSLQSNKAREAVELFDVIHSLDRPSLAAALAREAERLAGEGRAMPRLVVQVNTGEEPQKGGVLPAGLPELLDTCAELGLAVEGLMTVPPAEDPPSPHFGLLAKLAARHGLGLLSMGMSGDYEAAVALGATHVRVGSAIFGTRPA